MNRRQRPPSQRPTVQKISAAEKGIAYGFALIVIVALITLVMYPKAMNEGTLAIVRFLAALAGGLSAGLFLGEVQAEGTISKVLIRASGGFAVFLIILLFFFYGIPKESNDKPISFRYLTGTNDYPTLTLSILSPDIEDKITLNILSRFLGIDKPPIVHSDNPVFKSIEKFKIQTGNENTIANQNKFQYLLYSSNDGKDTVKDAINLLEPNKDQKADRFEVQYKGEDDTYTFHYAPISSPFLSDIDSAKYTTLIESERNNLIFQYPKLSDVGKFGIRDDFSYSMNSSLKDIWIKKIIQSNPNSRGFFAFAYPYTNSIEEFAKIIGGCRFDRDFLTRLMPSPYVKFLDVENSSNSTIDIDSVVFKIIDKESYDLTPVDNRDSLFNKALEKNQKFGIQLKPKHHLFIPIEFGFDTKAQQKIFDLSSPNEIEKLKSISKGKIYVGKPLLKSNYKGCSPQDINCIKSITQSIDFNDNLKTFLISPKELQRKITKRFAVGSILSINSIMVNGVNISIPDPQNNPSFLMSAVFNEGSCPYLLVYNSVEGKWVELGTVISNRKSKLLKGTDKYYLGNGVRKLELQERESEVSYIDSVQFVFEDAKTGEVQEVDSTIPNLSKIDDQYLVLHQGDSFEINVPNTVPYNASNLKVKINGYYEVI
jgi:translation elongation factor P/translation initiation factor 5A